MKFATFFGGAALLALLTLTLSNHNAVGQTLLSNPGGDTNPPVDPGDPYDGVAPSPQAYQIPTPNMYVAAGSDSAYAGINGALNWCIVGGSNPYVSIPIGREKMPVWQPPNGGVVAYPGNPELVTAQLDVMFYALGVGQELAIRINSNEVFELTSTQNESWGQSDHTNPRQHSSLGPKFWRDFNSRIQLGGDCQLYGRGLYFDCLCEHSRRLAPTGVRHPRSRRQPGQFYWSG